MVLVMVTTKCMMGVQCIDMSVLHIIISKSITKLNLVSGGVEWFSGCHPLYALDGFVGKFLKYEKLLSTFCLIRTHTHATSTTSVMVI